MLHGFADPEHIKRERAKGKELRESQWWRQQIGTGVCYHCQQKFAKNRLTMDHLIPVARGGKSTKSNCVVACQECNAKKGHRLQVELTMDQMSKDLASGNVTVDSSNRDDSSDDSAK